jgi:chromosome segregation ATPase
MGEITILAKTYSLPNTKARLQAFTKEVQQRIQVVKNGVIPSPKLLGFIPRRAKKLNLEERFTEIEKLVTNYSQIINELRENKEQYIEFFALLGADVQHAVRERARQIREAEGERRRLQQELREHQQDEAALTWLQEQEERLREAVRILGGSALLLLKKLSLCKRGVETLASEQESQRQLLERLRGMLALHRRIYALDQKISRIEHDVQQMAQMALHFEEYLRDYFGPLQELLAQVFQVDKSLSTAMLEIETISKDLSQNHGQLPESILDILVGPQLQQERLRQLAESLSLPDHHLDHFDTTLATHRATVEDGLSNIMALVDQRLETLWGLKKSEEKYLLSEGDFLFT